MFSFSKKIDTKCDLCLEVKKIENKCEICKYSMCKGCFDSYIDYGNNNCAQCRSNLVIDLEENMPNMTNKKCNIFLDIEGEEYLIYSDLSPHFREDLPLSFYLKFSNKLQNSFN